MWQTAGQQEVLALFKRSLETGHLAHAYLLVGRPHVGKRTLAHDLARLLNCQGAEPPCGECQACRKIIDDKHADVVCTGLDDVKPRFEIGIDDIKQLQRSAGLPSYEGKCKVFIIDGAEYLSTEAANCMLKVLEEPSPWVTILLLTADEARILPTVASRCQRVELKPMPCADIEKTLAALNEVMRG